MNEESLGPVVGSWLRDVDRPMPAPDRSIRRAMEEVGRTPQVRGWVSGRFGRRGSTVSEGRSMSVLATLVVGAGFVLAGGLFLSGQSTPPPFAPGVAPASATPASATPTERRIHWTTEVADLTAGGLSIEANDLVFTAAGAAVDVLSDPGGPDYWSLEMTWFEQDREQRLFMYFGSNGTDWWVDEIRAYDGYREGEWIYALGPYFRTRLGEAFEDDVRIELSPNAGPTREANRRRADGVLTIEGMRLTVAPRDLNDLAAIPPGGGLDPSLNPFWKGQPLHCSGILSLSPAEAHERLLDAGYRVSYRLLGATPEDFDPTKPPEGVIESASLDRYGAVNIAVDDSRDPRDPLPRCSRGN